MHKRHSRNTARTCTNDDGGDDDDDDDGFVLCCFVCTFCIMMRLQGISDIDHTTRLLESGPQRVVRTMDRKRHCAHTNID